MSEMISAYLVKFNHSLLLSVIFLGGYLFTKFVLSRKVKSKKNRARIGIRLKYAFFILFMIFFIKIWVEGFIQILGYIGVVAAAITLTQKDNLMNLVGWLIINWRGLFSEEDYIKISNYSGYVKSIGYLYFSLLEASPEFPENATGRLVRIPNGLVARNPVTNFSHEKLVECTMNFIFKPKGNFDAIEKLFTTLKQEVLQYVERYKENEMKKIEPKYYVKIRQEKPAGYEIFFLFYCKYSDRTTIQYQINKRVIDATLENTELVLAFD